MSEKQTDHARGCQGREYTCTCGYDDQREWKSMRTAPKNKRFLAVVDGVVRTVRYGKTSHVPLYGFCLADQGAEDFDLCKPTAWMHIPSPPKPLPTPSIQVAE